MTSRGWCFTLNTPTADEEQTINSPPSFVKWIVFQEESGHGCAHAHFQGVLEAQNAIRMAQLKNWLPRAHWEKRKGSPQQAVAYCTKDDTRVRGPFLVGLSQEDLDSMLSGGKKNELNEIMTKVQLPNHLWKEIQDVYVGWPNVFYK